MSTFLLTAAAILVGAILIPLAILTRTARQRWEQARDQDADRLRDACNTFHDGGVTK